MNISHSIARGANFLSEKRLRRFTAVKNNGSRLINIDTAIDVASIVAPLSAIMGDKAIFHNYQLFSFQIIKVRQQSPDFNGIMLSIVAGI